jgi:poly(3-hydroxyalkanoate) synthetase
LATREDHIAGVVNRPGKPKYQYWTGEAPLGNLERWIAHSTEHAGSWWPDWLDWIKVQDDEMVPRAERRQARGHRGCAGELRQGAGVRRPAVVLRPCRRYALPSQSKSGAS